jgi:hypothetical protein
VKHGFRLLHGGNAKDFHPAKTGQLYETETER